LFLVFLPCFIFGQRLTNISLSPVNSQNQTGTKVLVRFTILQGIACPGYEILHSADSISFIPIYSYSGICGNQTVDETYDYLHTGPITNALNYYRVSIPGYETSPTYRIYVGEDSGNPSILVYPNPLVTYQSYLSFNLSNYVTNYLEGFIISQNGQKGRQFILAVNQDYGQFPVSELENGLYFLWLTDGKVALQSKFIVKRP
jgi:hypothetical protein